jgi:hypothetical protein
MSENDDKERTAKHLIRDLMILIIPFAIIYIIYLLFLK